MEYGVWSSDEFYAKSRHSELVYNSRMTHPVKCPIFKLTFSPIHSSDDGKSADEDISNHPQLPPC